MKLLLWVSLLGLVALAYSQVSDCSMNCSKGCQCPCAKAKTKPLQKFTKMKGKGLLNFILKSLNLLLKARIRSLWLTPLASMIQKREIPAEGEK